MYTKILLPHLVRNNNCFNRSRGFFNYFVNAIIFEFFPHTACRCVEGCINTIALLPPSQPNIRPHFTNVETEAQRVLVLPHGRDRWQSLPTVGDPLRAILSASGKGRDFKSQRAPRVHTTVSMARTSCAESAIF